MYKQAGVDGFCSVVTMTTPNLGFILGQHLKATCLSEPGQNLAISHSRNSPLALCWWLHWRKGWFYQTWGTIRLVVWTRNSGVQPEWSAGSWSCLLLRPFSSFLPMLVRWRLGRPKPFSFAKDWTESQWSLKSLETEADALFPLIYSLIRVWTEDLFFSDFNVMQSRYTMWPQHRHDTSSLVRRKPQQDTHQYSLFWGLRGQVHRLSLQSLQHAEHVDR